MRRLWRRQSNRRPGGLDDGDDVGITVETDPEVGVVDGNYVPKWGGSALVTGTIYDDGDVGIGTTSPVAALDVNGPAKILAWHDQQVDPNGYAWVGSILFQWGTRTSTSDSSEWFGFPIEFPTECFAVSPALPGVVVPDTGGFYLDRHDDYGPTHIFRFLAIGH